MNWTAVIPLKGSGERKSRLAGRLDTGQRQRLATALFRHVAETVSASPLVAEVTVLSNPCPPEWQGGFHLDQGRGLNVELTELAGLMGQRPLLVVHADLPFVSIEDIAVLLAAAGGGAAIAPDRHGTGTNAIAVSSPSGFAFAFGADSCTRHLAASGNRAAIVARPGLGLDIDTPDDLDVALRLGYSPPVLDR